MKSLFLSILTVLVALGSSPTPSLAAQSGNQPRTTVDITNVNANPRAGCAVDFDVAFNATTSVPITGYTVRIVATATDGTPATQTATARIDATTGGHRTARVSFPASSFDCSQFTFTVTVTMNFPVAVSPSPRPVVSDSFTGSYQEP